MPVDYQGGKIYTIRAPETDKYYIGSTTQTLPKRFHEHKRHYKSYQNGEYHYTTSYQILELEGAYIELLELYPCNSKIELERREGELIREHRNNCVNRYIAGRTHKEWCEDNKEEIKAYKHGWYETNKEALIAKANEYREANREQINIKKREYYEANKETQKAKQAEKINCECGASIQRNYISKHRKTDKHEKLMDAKNE